MRRKLKISPLGIFCAAAGLAAQCFGTTLFYGGDFDPTNGNSDGLANETDLAVSGSPYGVAVYQNFVIPIGQTWTITDLFSNDLMDYSDTTAYYEIRSGISEGNGGTLLDSGDAAATQNPTGRSGFGFTEYNVDVSGLDIVLGPGTYWLAVVPDGVGEGGNSFASNTFGVNQVGTDVSDQQFWNSYSSTFTANFTNADNEPPGMFPNFSMGVLGSSGGSAVPEPGSMALGGFGLLLLGALRRKLKR